jgi:hypothetical protein
MKKSELKQLIKEEIQKEIRVSHIGKNDLSNFERMLEPDFGGDYTFLRGFTFFNTFEEWMDNEIEMNLDDEDPEEKEEYERLAKIYYDWKSKGLIYISKTGDDDEPSTNVLLRSYKRITTVGIGFGRVLTILTVF